MKILLIGNKVSSKQEIKSYSTAQSFHIAKCLNDLNIGTFFVSQSSIKRGNQVFIREIIELTKQQQIDFIVALGVNFFGKIDRSVGLDLQQNFKGIVAQISDGTLFDGHPVDLNLTVRDQTASFEKNVNDRLNRHKHCNFCVQWAADNELCFPQQTHDGTLRIFVDHSTFTETYIDHTLTILMNLKKLELILKEGKIPCWSRLEVKTLSDAGINKVDLNNIVVKPYHRTPVPFSILSKELGVSNIFFSTHSESLGLTLLEAQMSGAFCFVPKGTINEDILQRLNYFPFERQIDWIGSWERIQSNLNPTKNSLLVQKYNWRNLTLNMLEGLLKYKKRNKEHMFPLFGSTGTRQPPP